MSAVGKNGNEIKVGDTVEYEEYDPQGAAYGYGRMTQRSKVASIEINVRVKLQNGQTYSPQALTKVAVGGKRKLRRKTRKYTRKH